MSDRLRPGTRVRTTQDGGATDWIASARANCQWGEEGEVVRSHSGHGLCYTVRHEDGSKACYNPDELEVA